MADSASSRRFAPSASSSPSPEQSRWTARSQRSAAVSSSPELGHWTVKKDAITARRHAATSNIVWPKPRAPLSPDMSQFVESEDHAELRDMWQLSRLNRYYVPVSRLPPLGSDPRRLFAGKVPQCFEDRSVNRLDQIVSRWHSMPQLRMELSQEAMEEIEAKDREMGDIFGLTHSPAEKAALPKVPAASCDQAAATLPARTRKCAGKKKGKCDDAEHQYPHIPCACCEHRKPRKWTEHKKVGSAASALIAETMRPAA